MYKTVTEHQITFFDFNQSCGMQLEEKNEWVVLSTRIDWSALEKLYASLFPSHRGHPAKPLRMALGALIIQKRKKLSDRALVKEIAARTRIYSTFWAYSSTRISALLRQHRWSHFGKGSASAS